MYTEYGKEYSNYLNKEMEFKRYGNSGKPCLVFPPQNGKFHDYEDFKMVETLSGFIEQGKIQLFCVDSIDSETWSDKEGNPRIRIEKQESWFKYISEEFIPKIHELTGRKDIIVTGCSMGGSHAGILFFRRPDLFETLISLSAAYNPSMFFGDYMDNLIYDNSPVHFLKNIPSDHYYLDLYRQKNIIICIGQGAWEEDLIPGNREMEAILKEKNVPAWVDFWGYDVAHDWDWWQIQIKYFMEKVLNE